jgi:hypothetical protein
VNESKHPIARTCAWFGLNNSVWPVVVHDGKLHLPVQAVVEFLNIPQGVANDIHYGPLAGAFDIRFLAVDTGIHVNEPVKMIALERLQVMLASIALFNGAKSSALEMSHAVARLLRIQPSVARSASEQIEPKALRVEVAVEGGTPELNRALAQLILNAIDRIPGTRIDPSTATKH